MSTKDIIRFIRESSFSIVIVVSVASAGIFDVAVGGLALWLMMSELDTVIGQLGYLIPLSMSIMLSATVRVFWRKVKDIFDDEGMDAFKTPSVVVNFLVGLAASVLDIVLDGSSGQVLMGLSPIPGYGTFGGMYKILTGTIIFLSACGEPLILFLEDSLPDKPVFQKMRQSKKNKKDHRPHKHKVSSQGGNMENRIGQRMQVVSRDRLFRYYDNATESEQRKMDTNAIKNGFKSFKNKIHEASLEGKLDPVQ